MSFDSILSILAVAFVVITATIGKFLTEYLFLYPLFMSFIWTTGAIFYYFHWERHDIKPDTLPILPEEPPLVSILVPCYNEAAQVADTIEALAHQTYPKFEIIAINDGSSDRTGEMLDSLLAQYPTILRVVHHAENQGKAMSLRSGTLVAKGEFLACIDCDAALHPNAIAHLVHPLIIYPRVGATTGNPRVRSRQNLLGKIQVGEFSSIIGLIKRAQRVYGRVFTVSGVICAFRRRALHRIGYWSPFMVTEDIDVSWRLQKDHWTIQYVPNAIGWIDMPLSWNGLWKQRLRWAQGGAEVFLKNLRSLFSWRRRRMWGVLLEYIMSTAWAFMFIIVAILWVVGKFIALPEWLAVPSIFPPSFWGLTLALACIAQFVTTTIIESRYEPKLWRGLIWMMWYPMIFWYVSMITVFVGFPKALFKKPDEMARWKSPDRPLRSI